MRSGLRSEPAAFQDSARASGARHCAPAARTRLPAACRESSRLEPVWVFLQTQLRLIAPDAVLANQSCLDRNIAILLHVLRQPAETRIPGSMEWVFVGRGTLAAPWQRALISQ